MNSTTNQVILQKFKETYNALPNYLKFDKPFTPHKKEFTKEKKIEKNYFNLFVLNASHFS